MFVVHEYPSWKNSKCGNAGFSVLLTAAVCEAHTYADRRLAEMVPLLSLLPCLPLTVQCVMPLPPTPRTHTLTPPLRPQAGLRSYRLYHYRISKWRSIPALVMNDYNRLVTIETASIRIQGEKKNKNFNFQSNVKIHFDLEHSHTHSRTNKTETENCHRCNIANKNCHRCNIAARLICVCLSVAPMIHFKSHLCVCDYWLWNVDGIELRPYPSMAHR